MLQVVLDFYVTLLNALTNLSIIVMLHMFCCWCRLWLTKFNIIVMNVYLYLKALIAIIHQAFSTLQHHVSEHVHNIIQQLNFLRILINPKIWLLTLKPALHLHDYTKPINSINLKLYSNLKFIHWATYITTAATEAYLI